MKWQETMLEMSEFVGKFSTIRKKLKETKEYSGCREKEIIECARSRIHKASDKAYMKFPSSIDRIFWLNLAIMALRWISRKPSLGQGQILFTNNPPRAERMINHGNIPLNYNYTCIRVCNSVCDIFSPRLFLLSRVCEFKLRSTELSSFLSLFFSPSLPRTFPYIVLQIKVSRIDPTRLSLGRKPQIMMP